MTDPAVDPLYDPSADLALRSRVKPRVEPTVTQKALNIAIGAAERLYRAEQTISPDTLHAEAAGRLTKTQARDLMRSEKFASAMRVRGFALDPMADLTPQQRYALAIFADASVTTSHAQKLRMMGITSATWDGWLKQSTFAAYMADLNADMLLRAVPIATQRLTELADQGNVKAIDRVLAWTKTYDHRKTQDVDVNALLMTIFQVLDEEGVSPVTMQRLAGRVSAFGAATQLGNGGGTMMAAEKPPRELEQP